MKGGDVMSKNDLVKALRDPEYRSKFKDFDHPAGLITDEELKAIVGAGEPVNPDSTLACGVISATVSMISAAQCPSTKCTSQCTNIKNIC